MPVVTMPDGALVDLPDNPSPDQLSALQKLQGGQAIESVKEIGRVVDKGVRKGVLATPGLLGDLTLAATRALDTKAGKDVSMGSAPLTVLQGMLKLFGNASEGTKFGDVTHALETAGGLAPEVSQPKTEVGKAAANVLEPTVATVLGGGAGTIGQKAAIGALGGAGGEGAARMFGDNPLVRFIGSLLGSGAAGAVQAQIPNDTKLIKQATEHMTDADWQKAEQLQKVLDATGVPHAKSQLLGPRSTLDDVVATASANPSVRPKIITATEAAPKKAEEALNVWTAQNLPPPGPANRASVLTDVQQAADEALRQIRSKSNNAFAAAMPPKSTTYDQGRVKALYNSLRQLADDPRFGATTDAGKAINRLAEDLVESRTWDTSKVNPTVMLRAQQDAKAAGQPLDPSQIPGARQVIQYVDNAHKINNINKELKLMATKEDYKGLPIDDVRRILNLATPEFNRARDAKRAVMDTEYNPASQGLTGQIAQMGGGVKPDKLTAKDTALNMVFNPTQAQPQEIRQLARTMGGDQVGELLREHISRTMQQVLRQDDKNPRSFVQALYESPAQKANIDAALEVTANQYKMNPNAVKVGFQRLMESLDSFKDLKIAGGVSPATTAAQAGQNVVSQVATPLTGTRRFFEQMVTRKTYDKIADLVTSPDGLQKLRAIAKEPNQAIVRQMAFSVFGSVDAGNKK